MAPLYCINMYLTTSIRIILYITYGIRAGFYLDSNFFLCRLLTFSSSLFFSHLFLCVKMDASTNSATFSVATSAAETVVSTTNSPLHINMSNIIKSLPPFTLSGVDKSMHF